MMHLRVRWFSLRRSSPHPHLKEKHTMLGLLSAQIPFPHLCRSRDHVCQDWGQACYSCELLQTELKETLKLSLKGMWNILVTPVLLFRIKKKISNQYCEKRECKASYTRQTILSTPIYKLSCWMIKITGCGLFIIISCLPCLIRLLDFLLWGLLTAPGAKQSSYRNSRHVNLYSVLSQISSLEVQPKTFVFFSSPQNFCNPFPKGNSFHVKKKKTPYISTLTDKLPITLQTLWESALLQKTHAVLYKWFVSHSRN